MARSWRVSDCLHKMYIYPKLLFILFVTSKRDTKGFLIVKPLLQYADSVQSQENKFSELIDKIRRLKASIKIVKSQRELSNEHTKNCLTNNVLKASNKALADKIQDMISGNKNNEAHLNTQLRNANSETLELKDQDKANLAKIKELEKSIIKKNPESIQNLNSSCIGKLSNIYDIKVPGTMSTTGKAE
nr:uncharacterized protein LOC116651586 [Drosophila virilis]